MKILAWTSWWLDFKLGLRMLIRNPVLTLVSCFGIAVSVAIAAASYSVIYGNILASTLPVPEAGRVVVIEMWDSLARRPESRITRDFQQWREASKSLDGVGAFRTLSPTLVIPGTVPATVRVAAMSASGFAVARVAPLLGRYLSEDDERPGAPPVAVIGETVWRGRFGADPAILNRTVQLGSAVHTIVGVMPASFGFPVNDRWWVPLRLDSTLAEPLSGPQLTVFARLSAGATIESAQAELRTLTRNAAAGFSKQYAQLRPVVLPYTRPFLGVHSAGDESGLHALQGTVSLILLMVCLNVAILAYSRTAARGPEMAVRTALGASRGRIVTQLFLEAFALSAFAAAAGVGLAAIALRQIEIAILPSAADLPYWLSFRVSGGAALYAAAASVLAAAIVGVLPALKATSRDIHNDLRASSAGSGLRFGWTWTSLVIAQVAFVVAILPTAVANTWDTMRSALANPGFAAEQFLTAEVAMEPAVSGALRVEELIRRVESEPGVAAVTWSMAQPGSEPGTFIEPDSAEPATHEARFNRVSADFFRDFEVPVLAGRGLEPGDTAAVVVNQSLALRLFGGNAVGRRIRDVTRGGNSTDVAEPGPWLEIVGIVQDFPAGVSPGMDDSPLKLYHLAAAPAVLPVALAVRVSAGRPDAFASRLLQLAADLDPEIQLRGISPLDEALRREQWIRRGEAITMGALTLSALLLSAAGIYSLISFTVSLRRREIGIRSALGAGRVHIVAGVLSRAFRHLGAGVLVGLALGFAIERGTGLAGDNSTAVIAMVLVLIVLTGAAASAGPARRILRIEPSEALRDS